MITEKGSALTGCCLFYYLAKRAKNLYNRRMTKLVKNIEKLIALLQDGNSWCREGAAQKLSGEKCEYDDKDAAKWCLLGGSMKLFGLASVEYFEVYNFLRGQVGQVTVSHFNDTSKHKDIMKFLQNCLVAAKNPTQAKAA